MSKESRKNNQAKKSANLTIATYSEKAFVVFGDTKKVKDMLKEALHLRFNARLKCGAGWIGSMKKVSEAEKMLGLKLQKMTEDQLLKVGEDAKKAFEKEKKAKDAKKEAKKA